MAALSLDPSAVVVAVTGAAGFVGGAVCRSLAEAGCSVRVLWGPPDDPAAARAARARPGLLADVTDAEAMAELVAGASHVVHLAGPPSVVDSFSQPVRFARDHVVGTTTLLDVTADSSVRRLVHVSSAEVYGQPRRSPVSEDDELVPTSPYGAAKLGAEAMVRAVTPSIGIETVILRPFVIYGRGMRATSVVATVVAQAVAGPLVEVADPRPVRDFVHVDDVARAVSLACLRPLPAGPQTCNIGSGTGTSIAQLAELALLAAGRRGEVRSHGPDRSAAANIDGAVADTRRAAELLGWRPEIALAAGLAGMVADARGGEDG